MGIDTGVARSSHRTNTQPLTTARVGRWLDLRIGLRATLCMRSAYERFHKIKQTRPIKRWGTRSVLISRHSGSDPYLTTRAFIERDPGRTPLVESFVQPYNWAR